MAVATKDGRYMPALAVMVLLILAVTAWWLYGLNFGPAGKPAAATTEQPESNGDNGD